ncbi:MAG: homing endonuclease associated repeat-containing protein [Candidatus Aenigmatarchaeota archaeon]
MGRTPTVEEIAGDKSIPSAALYFRRFGSYNNALKEAGLDINVKKGRYTDKKLIELLQNKAKELGRTPSQRGMEEDGSLPSGRTYQDRFGSWNEALDAAGLGTNRDFYTDKELLSLLKNKAEELGRTPTVREVNTDKSMPGASTYSDRFGSWNKAVKAAGLEPYNQKFEKQYSNEELLNVLKKKAKELGRTPHVSDIDADKSIASIAIYYQRFGSFKNALKEAGLERKNYNYSDEELVDILKKKHEEAGKSPTAREIDEDKSIPSSNTYISRFGSWNKALEAANIEPNYKIKPKRRSLTEKLLEERL